MRQLRARRAPYAPRRALLHPRKRYGLPHRADPRAARRRAPGAHPRQGKGLHHRPCRAAARQHRQRAAQNARGTARGRHVHPVGHLGRRDAAHHREPLPVRTVSAGVTHCGRSGRESRHRSGSRALPHGRRCGGKPHAWYRVPQERRAPGRPSPDGPCHRLAHRRRRGRCAQSRQVAHRRRQGAARRGQVNAGKGARAKCRLPVAWSIEAA